MSIVEKVSSLYRECKRTAMGSKMSLNFSSLHKACSENDYVFPLKIPSITTSNYCSAMWMTFSWFIMVMLTVYCSCMSMSIVDMNT